MTTYLRHLCGLVLLLLVGTAQAVDLDLYAVSGTTTLRGNPTALTANVLGYSTDGAAVAAPGGPPLIVNEGETVTVTLHNNLTESTAILFQGQGMIPDTVGVPANGTKTYTFTATTPGTFLYEAGLLPNAQHQAAMGLHGALVVRPLVSPQQAYGDATTTFNDEAILVLSELDTNLNANGATFDMRDYKPQYFLINGVSYPDTTTISTAPGNKVLLRYVNAGQQSHSMTVLGMQQTLIGKDGSAIAYPSRRAAETIAPGETLDAIATVPAGAVPGSKFALFDGNLSLHNSNAAGYGGMLTFLLAGTAGSGGGGGGDVIGPVATGVTLAPNAVAVTTGIVALTASISDVASGNSNVAGAEYFIDVIGGPGAGTAMAGSFASPVVAVNATIPAAAVALLASGTHAVYVRGRDSAGNWGAVASSVLSVDKAGPTTSGLVLTPAPTNGTSSVALNATADDQASGGANISAAEYFVDATGASGTGAEMTASPMGTAPVASLSATIPAATINGLSEGSHTISVHARDSRSNWGAFASKALVIDKTGPTISAIAATPGATNGTTGLSSSQPVVRITATASDLLAGGVNSNIAAAEGFLDTVGATGSGFVLLPADGAWDETPENAFGDIPLTALATLREENHPVHVHARDAAGNWGATSSVSLLVDRTPPVLSGATLAFNPAAGYIGTPVVMTVNGASDPPPVSPNNGPPSGVAGGEYWFGSTAPAPGGGTPFTFASTNTVTIPTTSLAAGTYAVGVRIRDVAGNWSKTTISGNFTVALNSIFADGFETGGTSAWSSRSTNITTRLNVTAAAALFGSRGLQAQGDRANYVQFNFGTAANPATPTFDARFHFRPNGNASTASNIFSAATAQSFNTTLFRVRYRINAGNPQVQIQLGTANTNSTWTNLLGGTSDNLIEVVWQSGSMLVLHVNGAPVQTLTGGNGSVGAFRLGSVSSGGSNTLMYFDQFAAKRLLSPLLGP